MSLIIKATEEFFKHRQLISIKNLIFNVPLKIFYRIIEKIECSQIFTFVRFQINNIAVHKNQGRQCWSRVSVRPEVSGGPLGTNTDLGPTLTGGPTFIYN